MMQHGRPTKSGALTRWLMRWRSRRERRERAARLYVAAARCARTPRFYRELGVPDTPQGRFEMVTAHVVLLTRALGRMGEMQLAQEVVDAFFRDVDRNLREMGVGDLSVGRKMRRLAGRYLTRARELAAALDREDEQALAAILARGLGSPRPPDAGMHALARHLLAEERRLSRMTHLPAEANGIFGFHFEEARPGGRGRS